MIEKEDLISFEEVPVWYWCLNRGVWRGPMYWVSRSYDRGYFHFPEWDYVSEEDNYGVFLYTQAEDIKPVLDPDGGFGCWTRFVTDRERRIPLALMGDDPCRMK